jgi:ATP-dependent DNA helicase DinG
VSNVSIPFIALALTTTGPNPRRDRVCRVSAVTVDSRGARSGFAATVCSQAAARGGVAGRSGAASQETKQRWQDVAVELRALLAGQRVVAHDAAASLAVLAAEGVRLDMPPIDLDDLASILVPGLAATDLATLAATLGAVGADADGPRSEAEVIADVFDALLVRIAEYDNLTLERLELHTLEGGWPFFDLFNSRAVVRVRGRRSVDRLAPPELAFLRERPREDELEPTGSIDLIAPDDVDAIIGPSGALSQVIPEFERRPQQEQMAAAVAEAINSGGQILVEAGTGTGKSLAYLVPAALMARDRGQPVMLSTNTLALQDQLLRKDVPDLVAALGKANGGSNVGVVSVKGRANYLCLRKWFPWERQASLEPDEARLKAKVLAWLPRTETGDRAELRLTGGEEAHWRQICEDEGNCDPGSCIFHQRGQCFLFRARRAAESAHLVVVNHALLLTDAASSNRILPDYDTLVIDEAHHLEDQATTQFTVSLSERDLTEYADAVAGSDGVAMSGVAAGAVAFLLGQWRTMRATGKPAWPAKSSTRR